MKRLFKNNRGTAPVEFALVSLPVLMFICGVLQISWVIWTDNLLQMAVDTAARCGAVQTDPSNTTLPCYGPTTAQMIQTANLVFEPLSGAAFNNNSSCSGGSGLAGSYTVNIAFVVNLTLTANSCYPAV
jgi:Flp pilus assembly protein TadG